MQDKLKAYTDAKTDADFDKIMNDPDWAVTIDLCKKSFKKQRQKQEKKVSATLSFCTESACSFLTPPDSLRPMLCAALPPPLAPHFHGWLLQADADNDGDCTLDEWYMAYEADLKNHGHAHVSKDLITLEVCRTECVCSDWFECAVVLSDRMVCNQGDQTTHQQTFANTIEADGVIEFATLSLCTDSVGFDWVGKGLRICLNWLTGIEFVFGTFS